MSTPESSNKLHTNRNACRACLKKHSEISNNKTLNNNKAIKQLNYRNSKKTSIVQSQPKPLEKVIQKNNSTIVENNSTIVENDSTIVENNSTIVENNSTIVENNIQKFLLAMNLFCMNFLKKL
jgi:hypothetical protein